MSEFIFMLTQNDVTKADAIDVYKQIRRIESLNFVGFKNIGLEPEDYRELMRLLREDGKRVFLEVVSGTEEASVKSAEMAVALGVDYLVGTFREFIPATLKALRGTKLKFMPYAGEVFDHPCFLRGTAEEIAADAKRIEALGVSGINLLAYRHVSLNGEEVAKAVVRAVKIPVIVAGSVTSGAQIERLNRIGVWAFTVGGAVFDRTFMPGGSYAENVEEIVRLTR
jgi:2,4-dienoyl-CoA reductase-like NADH-dependent reductase (Old Yellow Enzyme family)